MDHSIKLNFLSQYSLIIFASYLANVESVPEPYCLKTFNHSDCGMPRTAVFHYYKPGSRCEIVYWSGCPTANMFANEYQCSHHCIMKLFPETLESPDRMKPQPQHKKWDEKINELDPNELEKVRYIINDIERTTESETEHVDTTIEDTEPTVDPEGGETASTDAHESGETTPTDEQVTTTDDHPAIYT